jgi:hypothetical protein
VADEGGELPESPARDTSPGWHQVGTNANHQAYWDGATWTARRRWAGAGWIESPLSPGDGRGHAAASSSRSGRRPATSRATSTSGLRKSWIVAVVAVVVVAGVVLGVAVAATQAAYQAPNWVVNVTLTGPGAVAWDTMARRYFHEIIGIDLDGRIVSAPLTQPAQSAFVSFAGRVQVTGDFTQEHG